MTTTAAPATTTRAPCRQTASWIGLIVLGEEYQDDVLPTVAHLGMQDGDGTAAMDMARQIARRIGAAAAELRAYIEITDALERRGKRQRAAERALDGFARTRQLGLARSDGWTIGHNLAESLIWLGRWDQALDVVGDALRADPTPEGRAALLLLRGQITVARGDSQPAWRAVEEIQSPFSAPADTSVTLPLARLDIEARLADGDTSGALAAASAIAAQRGTADPRYLWPLLATAMRACAEASGPPELRRALQARARGLTRPGPAEGAQALTFMAEAARAAGREDLTGWDAAAAAWQALNQPYPLAYALVRAASAAARAGDKQAAAVRLRRAAVIADQLAARPLLLQISQLARRAKIAPPAAARLDPAKRPVRSPAAAALTEREREVVTLVAAGLSNAQIAERLVISPLTAKTHVSRAMTKLGARDRAQLVVLAYQAGLGRPTPT